MKTILCLAFLSVAARATVVYIDSDASSTGNNAGHPTVDLTGALHPDPSWVAALPGSDWISYGSTGDPSDPGHFSPPPGTRVTFKTQFILSGAITGASLEVLADDFSWVILNGHLLIPASIKPGASTEETFTFAEMSPYLLDGTDTLAFSVMQVRGRSFGVDFAGQVDDGTPEPSTVALIGAGLVILGALSRRK